MRRAHNINFIPWLIAVAFFMESLDTTILNTGVPVIARALAVEPLSMKAVLSSYTLALAVFIPISGWMADRFGTRRVFTAAIGVFTLGSALCGLAGNVHVLVACRVLQGMGGAMMVPVGRLTLVRSFPKNELVRAMSFVAVPSLIAPTLGPLVGGLIVDYLNWRMIFFINIPIGLLGLILVWLNLPDYQSEKHHPLDLLGLILFGSGVALLSYVLEVFGEHLLSVSEILGLVAISGALILGYWLHSLRSAHPLLMLGLYRFRTFAVATGGSFLTRLGIGGMPFLLPLLYQLCLGLDPVQSGLLIMPQALGAITTKGFLPHLIRWAGYRRLLTLNTVLVGVWIMLFAFVEPRTPVWLLIPQIYILGALTSIQFAGMNTLTYADVPGSKASGASSIASTLQQMSISFGVAIAGMLAMVFLPTGGAENRTGMLQGLHMSFLALGAYTILSSAIFHRLHGDDGAHAAGRDKRTEEKGAKKAAVR